MSHVTCHISPVTCHLSPTPILTATVTDPPPAKPPTMHNRLVRQKLKPKKPKRFQTSKNKFLNFHKKNFLSFAILAIRSLSRSLQSTRIQSPTEGTDTSTDIATYRLNWPSDRFRKTFPTIFLLLEY